MQCYICQKQTEQKCYDCGKPICEEHSTQVEAPYLDKRVTMCEVCQALATQRPTQPHE
jgi:hypothetical protein